MLWVGFRVVEACGVSGAVITVEDTGLAGSGSASVGSVLEPVLPPESAAVVPSEPELTVPGDDDVAGDLFGVESSDPVDVAPTPGVDGSATATPGVDATATPTPNATASAPTRPMYLASPTEVPSVVPTPWCGTISRMYG
jgi:hypothetical protein